MTRLGLTNLGSASTVDARGIGAQSAASHLCPERPQDARLDHEVGQQGRRQDLQDLRHAVAPAQAGQVGGGVHLTEERDDSRVVLEARGGLKEAGHQLEKPLIGRS